MLWNLTTLLGALGAEAIGDTDAWGLDAAGPAVFLALLAPMLKTTTERAVAGIAVAPGARSAARAARRSARAGGRARRARRPRDGVEGTAATDVPTGTADGRGDVRGR